MVSGTVPAGKIRTLRLAAAAALLSVVATPVWAAPPDCAAAKKSYSANCASCHMADGKGNPILKSPDFTDSKWQAEHKDAALFAAISDGVKDTAMPGWKDQLKPAEINSLIQCVIRGFGKKAAPAHHASASHAPAKRS